MDIKSTSEYLKTLDEIAEFSDKNDLSVHQIRELNLLKLAVKKFEMQSVKQYPAAKVLIEDYKRTKFLLN